MEVQRKSLLLIANSGGHLTQLFALRDFWSKHDRTWITFENEHSSFLREMDENVIFTPGPIHQFIFQKGVLKNAATNIKLAYRLISSGKYDALITTGAAIGVIFVYIGKMFNVKSIFIDSLTRSKNQSMSAKLAKRVADINLTQWKEIADSDKRVLFKGRVL